MGKQSVASGIRILGVMTGTSCDGLDAAFVQFDAEGWQPEATQTIPFPRPLRERVFEIQEPRTRVSLRDCFELNRDLGEWYGVALNSLIEGMPTQDRPDAIANHGQTVGHFPAPGRKGFTIQLGDPTRISFLTGLTVVSNFREGDMAAGGQGAPLVPLFHRMLAHHLRKPGQGIAFHNIGGISNLTYISPDDEILAFDTGPGNTWIDLAAAKASGGKLKMDKGGRLAQKGIIDKGAIKTLLKHPFLKSKPPKSTGRDEFPFELFLKATRAKGPSLVATATAFTVETIAQAYEKWVIKSGRPLDAVYLCGGGARNPALVLGLQARMDSVRMLSLESAGLDAQFIESQAFALFGFLSLLGQPIGGPWTGVESYGPPAHIIPGANWGDLVSKIHSVKNQ